MKKNYLEKLFGLSGKVALLTGAGGFFGKYFSETLLLAGCKVVLMGHSLSFEKELNKLKNKYKGQVSGYKVDFYDLKMLEEILKNIVKRHKIDILINNAYDLSSKTGFNTHEGTLGKSTYNQWLSSFHSGIYWAVLTTQIIGSAMRKNNSGNIINIGSMYGIVAPDRRLYEGTKFLNPPTYGVMKAGLIALTKYTASFWGANGIRVNAIVPGPFSNTETITANYVKDSDPFIERLKNKTILNRIGHPRELSGALLFLASGASSYITGQVIVVDGGWTTI